MSILTGPEIQNQLVHRRLTLDPFDEQHLNPNSYNLAVGPTLLYYTDEVLDTRRANSFTTVEIPPDGYVLQPNRIYLGASVEVVGSDFYVPIIRSRSGAARLGAFVHVTADLIDQGSLGQTTFQFHAVQPLRIYAGDRLAQITFWRTFGRPLLYSGKYQGSQGPQPSLIHRDQLGVAA
ncbi:dCTP deaminase [Kitasatospora sp. MAA4]|uniref:dCTP deaminase n=1 Tax=Kitasatospora sp. MAA4 TaxID=3035093 RepID=UPI002473245E|nr:dCTP deaminase [Kitasatospora sp. MAA4]MDH6132429.1 dCTP deaminase [Kitasatospora sp. MAA4]